MSSATDKNVTFGQVKWFNNKSGFGFISTLSKDGSADDIFVHHSDLQVKQEQYRYLIAGEYVEFNIIDMDNSNNQEHKYKAVNVTGIGGGRLMCEVRMQSREETNTTTPRSNKRPEINSTDENVKKEWMVVRRKR